MNFICISQILSSSTSFFIGPIWKTECIENSISSSRFIELLFVTSANGARVIEGSIFRTRSTGTKSCLAAIGRIKFNEIVRFLLVDKKLLNASNPF